MKPGEEVECLRTILEVACSTHCEHHCHSLKQRVTRAHELRMVSLNKRLCFWNKWGWTHTTRVDSLHMGILGFPGNVWDQRSMREKPTLGNSFGNSPPGVALVPRVVCCFIASSVVKLGSESHPLRNYIPSSSGTQVLLR